MDTQAVSEESFGEIHFGQAKLGHVLRTARIVDSANAIVSHPGGTIPEKLQSPARTQAFYDLMARPEVTHASLLLPHRQQTVTAMKAHSGDLLIISDTTELDYSTRRSLKKLGPIGGGLNQGYLAHNSLVVDPNSRRVLGLISQILATRPETAKAPKKQKKGKKKKSNKSDNLLRRRESQLWVAGAAAVPEHECPVGSRWIDVCDRGADTFEFMESEVRRGRHFIVRSTHNRCILTSEESTKPDGKLHTWIRQQPSFPGPQVEVPANGKQPVRTANTRISFAPVRLAAPRQRRGRHGQEPLDLWVVRIYEPDPPAGAKRLEWILLTNVPVETKEDAQQIIHWYECRWIIEEYHKALKTGMAVEKLQLRSEEHLEPAIALLSVTALTLLNLRAAAEAPDAETRSAEEILDPLYVEVLMCWRYPERRRANYSIREFLYALARLGGHQNRRGDGIPGWQTLWKGWNQLHAMVAYERARKRKKRDYS